LHDAILETVGDRAYSAFVNEAILIALQARGIRQSVTDFEAEGGVITDDLRLEARRRRKAAADEARKAAESSQ